MGPLNSAAHYGRVTGLVAAGRAARAHGLVTGGDRPKGTALGAKGFWLSPTIFADVTADMRIGREEVFGPVMSFMSWTDEAEAIRIANSTPYGLTAAVYGSDITRVLRMARQIQAGVIARERHQDALHRLAVRRREWIPVLAARSALRNSSAIPRPKRCTF